jgi:hypothetical protein
MPLNLNVSATLADGLTAAANNGSITLTQIETTTSVDGEGEEHVKEIQHKVTLSYMDVTNFVAFARAAGWKSERKSRE